MAEPSEDLAVPERCVRWCHSQDYGVTVGDDLAEVDLDWWNTRLRTHRIPVRLWGRDPDGIPVDRGNAFLRRDDIDGPVPGEGPPDLVVLYRAAAWLSGHRDRARKRTFLDVRRAGGTPNAFTRITVALARCREEHPAHLDPGPYRAPSGWPEAPGVGNVLMSLYCWAVHPGPGRPQLLDQQSLATLCWLGWTETPAVDRYIRGRYLGYCDLLHRWAGEAQVPAELIEMWLVADWRERVRHREEHVPF